MYMSIIRTNDQAKQSARDVEFIVCWPWKRCALHMSNHSCTCVGPDPSVRVFFIFFLFFIFFYFVSVFTVLSLVTCLDRPM